MKKPTLGFIINIIMAAALSAGAVVFPYVSWIIMAVAAIFFMVCAYRYDLPKTIALLAASLASIAAAECSGGITIDNLCTSASTFCLVSLNGAVIGMLCRSKMNFRMVITGGCLVNLSAFLIDFAMYKFYYRIDLGEEFINRPIAEFFTYYREILITADIEGTAGIIEVLGDLQWYIQQMLATIVPSALIILCALLAYGIFLTGRKIIFRKYGTVMESYPHFWQLQLPRYASMVLAALFVITLFMSSSPLAGAVTNIIIIFCALYMVCGLSVVDFFFKRTNLHWAVRIIIYAIAFIVLGIIGLIIPVANISTVLLFAGVIDGMADFRRIRLGGEKDEA